jgi:Thioredoxin
MTDETESAARRAQRGSAAAFIGLATLVILVVALGPGRGHGGDTSLEGVGTVAEQLVGIPQHGMALGEPGAPVTLVEFGDLQGTVGRAFAEEVLPRVIGGAVRRGEAQLEFRNFPLLGPGSVRAGAAALAAGEQGRGWSFVELFYRNQGRERSGYVTPAFLRAVARGADVPDLARWSRESRGTRLLRESARTGAEARTRGFERAPAFLATGPGGAESLGTPESVEELEVAIHEVE